MLMSRGELRSAYRHRQRGAGMEAVALSKVFRVSRFFSYWKSCRSFHRIISLVSPVNEGIFNLFFNRLKQNFQKVKKHTALKNAFLSNIYGELTKRQIKIVQHWNLLQALHQHHEGENNLVNCLEILQISYLPSPRLLEQQRRCHLHLLINFPIIPYNQ